MAGRRPALQWRKLARQNCLRGRAARYVAAAALCLVAACGCCLATLLPLTTLLGVLAAVLLPSFLRCVQLRHVHGLLRQEVLLLEFVQRVPYCCVGIENRVDIAVPWLCVRQGWLRRWIQLLTLPGCACCADTIYASYLFFDFESCHSGPDMHVHVISSGRSCCLILLFLLHCMFCLCTPEDLRCYMVWYLFLRECWDCMQRVIGRVEATRSCCWRISFSVEYFLIWVGLRRGVVLRGSYSVCCRIITRCFPPKRSRMQRKPSLRVLSWMNLLHHTEKFHLSILIFQGVNLCIRNSRN